MLANYVLLDLETTGATPLRDRITEIALIHFQDGIEVARWQTLVNPEINIPDFIQSLTGISNEMVAAAPTFAEVAGELLDHLDGAVMCAHNVRFDHGFLKAEFKRIGISFKQRVLCTVKLSRKLYPEHKSHSLSALIERYRFTCTQRHRAMGDVEVMAQFIALAKQDLGLKVLQEAVSELSRKTSLPSGLYEEALDDIPETSGVYFFYGENNLPLYIGKSINLRARVMSHFSSDHRSTKEMRISQEIKRIDWQITAGEFGALLLESKLVKERQPIHNRQLRRERQLCAWRLAKNSDVMPLLDLVREDEITPENIGSLFGTFRSKKQAVAALSQIAEEQTLCLKALGLESGKGACFRSQIKRCKGVCCGKESSQLHYLRLQQALLSLKIKSWGFAGKIGIKEHNPITQKTDLHVFEHWCHIATVDDEWQLQEALQSNFAYQFDLDTYKLLLKALSKKSTVVVKL